MRIGSYRFRPTWLAIGLYLPMVSAMIGLGLWQLERAALKASVLAAAEAARRAEPVPIESVGDPIAAAEAYRSVSASGRWRPDRQLLWDNRVRHGIAGYEVLTPLELTDGRWLLVNRGWIAPGASRADLPAIDWQPPAATVRHDDVEVGEDPPVRISGLLSRPSKGFMSGPALEPGRGWPGVLQYFDYPILTKMYGADVIPAVLQWQPTERDRGAAPRLDANWRPVASGPERHYGYAFQWFAMAIALTVVLIVVNSRRIEPDAADERILSENDD